MISSPSFTPSEPFILSDQGHSEAARPANLSVDLLDKQSPPYDRAPVEVLRPPSLDAPMEAGWRMAGHDGGCVWVGWIRGGEEFVGWSTKSRSNMTTKVAYRNK